MAKNLLWIKDHFNRNINMLYTLWNHCFSYVAWWVVNQATDDSITCLITTWYINIFDISLMQMPLNAVEFMWLYGIPTGYLVHKCISVMKWGKIMITIAYTYRIEGNFGGGKHWRIWRMTINSPKFNPPIFILD